MLLNRHRALREGRATKVTDQLRAQQTQIDDARAAEEARRAEAPAAPVEEPAAESEPAPKKRGRPPKLGE